MKKDLLKRVLEQSISPVEYLILKDIEMEQDDYTSDEFFKEDLEILKVKDLLSENNLLTVRSRDILRKINGGTVISFYDSLHKKLQLKLFQLTGKVQYRLQGRYNFLPNSTDLRSKLQKVIKKYNIEDTQKIEKVLLKYVYDCYQANFDKVMLVDYYILKNDTSKFITDYENFEDKDATEDKIKSTSGGVYLI